MEFPKRNKSNRVLIDLAKYSYNSGAMVTIDRRFPWVLIEAEGEDNIFKQGYDADNFIAEVDQIRKRYRSFNEDVAALVVAKQYIECLWG